MPEPPPIPIVTPDDDGCSVIVLAPVPVMVFAVVLRTIKSAVMMMLPVPVRMVFPTPAVWVKVPVPAEKVSAVLATAEVRIPAVVILPPVPPIRNTMASRKTSALTVSVAVPSERPMVIDENPSLSRSSSVVEILNVSMPAETPTSVPTALGCRISAPLDEIVPIARVSASAVIVMSPLVEAMLSVPALVITCAPAPESVSVTLPEPLAVMSPSSVRLPNVSAISIAALAALVWTFPEPIVSPLASSRKMPPALVVACNVVTARSRAPLPPLAPIAPCAVRFRVPEVVMSAVVSSASSSIVEVLVRVMLSEPAASPVTVIAAPWMVTGSRKVKVLMSTAPESVLPMVIDEKVPVSRPSSVASRLKSPVAPSPRPMVSDAALGCRISAPVEVMLPPARVSRSAVMVIAPLVEAMSSSPSPVITALFACRTVRVTLPEPFAVMSSFRVRSPSVSVISIAALAPVVWTPVPPMIRPSASSRKMPPVVVVACNVPTTRSSSPVPALTPIAPCAVRLRVPEVVMSTVVLSRSSSIVEVLVRVMLLEPACSAVTTIAAP